VRWATLARSHACQPRLLRCALCGKESVSLVRPEVRSPLTCPRTQPGAQPSSSLTSAYPASAGGLVKGIHAETYIRLSYAAIRVPIRRQRGTQGVRPAGAWLASGDGEWLTRAAQTSERTLGASTWRHGAGDVIRTGACSLHLAAQPRGCGGPAQAWKRFDAAGLPTGPVRARIFLEAR